MSELHADRTHSNEELVAYLDGELGAEESRRVERLLADDPRVRVELQRLDRTWELLDGLPRAQVDPAFTRSTVEMIAVSLSDEAKRRKTPARRRRAWWLATGAMALAALAGAWAEGTIASLRNQRLLDDLSVLEHLEAYRQTPDLAFLRELAGEQSFAAEPSLEPAAQAAPILPAGAAGEARRQQVETMDADDKEQLVRKQKAFAELSPVEQERLRRLDQELAQAPDAVKLARALQWFQRWLNHLSAPERAHLQHAAGAGQRLARIKQLRAVDAKRLGPEDTHEFAEWWLEICLARLPGNNRKAFQKLTPEQQHEEMRRRLLDPNSAIRRAGQQRLASPDEFAQLRSKLSPEGRERLDRARADPAKRELTKIWLADAFHLRAASRAAGGAAKEISDERLRAFFEHLPDGQRNQLLGLPPDEMFRRLRAKYEREVVRQGKGKKEQGAADRD
ncbi:MAG TPA: hypothetical protein VGX76_04560 [Pirellulales bacterium]|jgi:hypothetical protein|nr:hypothetical protein [Pirellulales bacterium]